jgi:thiosulfate/3-mercaptopyruvate sulfurtransferase
MTEYFQTLIEVDQLFQLIGKADVVILDCRFYLDDISKGRKEYLVSHIPSAVFLDLAHDLSSPVIKGITGRHPLPHPDILVSALRAAGLNNSSQVIVYDQLNGSYAAHAWWLLRWIGHEKAAVLNGGFSSWISKNGALDNQWHLPQAGDFIPCLNNSLAVGMKDIEQRKYHLIDSREYRRYTGEFEPIDPVAGHIPGAICMPYMDNTDEQGKWKSPVELKNKFAEISDANQPVFYCGSGVTACHNVLAYKIATGKDAKLYPGSWSEWINYHAVDN